MRISSLHFILLCILIAICTYALYRFFAKEKQHIKLVHYVEAYYSSMMPPQINTKEAFVWFTGLQMPVFNAITHFYYTKNQGEHLDHMLQCAPPNKPISVWVEEWQDSSTLVKELDIRGFKKIVTCPFMTWQVTDIEKPAVTIKRTDKNTFDIFIAILSRVFGLDSETQQGYGTLHGNAPAENYLVYADDIAVGAGTLFVTGNVGLILNIAVLPEYQKRGFGSAISQFLMHRAYEHKLEKVVLNANPGAISVYQKLGFNKDYDLDIYAR